MRFLVPVFTLAVGFAAAWFLRPVVQPPKPETNSTPETVPDAVAIRGVWRVVEDLNGHMGADGRWTQVTLGEKMLTGLRFPTEYTIDPTVTPKAIDFVSANKRPSRGIYILNGSVLILRLTESENAGNPVRPASFTYKPGDRQAHEDAWLTLVKVKDEFGAATDLAGFTREKLEDVAPKDRDTKKKSQ